MLAMTRTFCIAIVLCSIALLTLNSSIPAPVDNNPVWSTTGATHELHTGEADGNHTLRARIAAFGTNIEEIRQVDLALTRDGSLGCSDDDFDTTGLSLRPEHDKDGDDGDDVRVDSWILLMRGECSFVDKVRNAQRHGFDGVVVGDDGNSYDSLITMFAKSTSDVRIPSLFVTHQSYTVLRSASATDARHLGLNIELTEMRTDWPLLDTLIFICFSPLCTLLIVYVVLFFRRRRLHLNNILPPAYLNKLETIEYMAKDGVNAECVICLENFEEEEKVLELPCKHLYHGDCIRKWLIERKKICPICKRDVSVGIDVREGRIDESALQSPEDLRFVRPVPSQALSSLRAQLLARPATPVTVHRSDAAVTDTPPSEETPLLRTAATQTNPPSRTSSIIDDQVQ